MVFSLKQKLAGVAIVALIVVAFSGFHLLHAAAQADIGKVDMQAVINNYLIPQVQDPLQKDKDNLQTEFDSKSKGMSDKDKTDLLNQYQQQLNDEKQKLLAAQWPKVDAAVAAVAQADGLQTVVDKQSVYYGGVDVTDQVLLKLGVKAGNASANTSSDAHVSDQKGQASKTANTSSK